MSLFIFFNRYSNSSINSFIEITKQFIETLIFHNFLIFYMNFKFSFEYKMRSNIEIFYKIMDFFSNVFVIDLNVCTDV